MIKEIVMYQVVCDNCGRLFKESIFGLERFDTQHIALNNSKMLGWIHQNGKSYCPYCSGSKNKEKINANHSGCPF